MKTKKAEAQRLADELDIGDFDVMTNYQAAAELRRLHAENERLQQALRGAELGSRANFASMQQQAALKCELLEHLKAMVDEDDQLIAAGPAKALIAKIERGGL